MRNIKIEKRLDMSILIIIKIMCFILMLDKMPKLLKQDGRVLMYEVTDSGETEYMVER